MPIEVPQSIEQSPAPKGVEVKATPIPPFDGNNHNVISDAFSANKFIVSGGDVTTADGTVIQTYGILGSAKIRIDSRLEQIAQTKQELTAEKDQFARRLLIGPRAVREVTIERAQTNSADNNSISVVERVFRGWEKDLEAHCKKNTINEAQRGRYDRLIKVENHLAGDDADNLQPIQDTLTELGLAVKTPTKEIVEVFLTGAKSTANGYEEYKRLSESRDHAKKELERNIETRDRNVEALTAKLEEAKARTKDWEERYAKYRTDDTPQQTRLKDSHELIDEVEAYLNDFVPNGDDIAKASAELTAAKDDLEESRGAYAVMVSRTKGAGKVRLEAGGASSIIAADEKKVKAAEARLAGLIDPIKRLTGANAPEELRNSVAIVTSSDFDIDKVPANQRVLVEVVMVLLGIGEVKVEEKGTEAETEASPIGEDVPIVEGPEVVVSETAEVVEPGLAPVEPEPAQIDLATASVDEIKAVASALTAEQIEQIPLVNRALLALDGAFTPAQLRNLSSDTEAAQTNGDFIDKYYDTLERYIESSANIHDADSSRGISRIEGMPRLILNALRQVASLDYNGQPVLDVERVMSADAMRESIGRLTNASIPSPLREGAIRAVKLLELADYARQEMLKGLK